MEFTKIVCGVFATNSYFLQKNDEVILIDPASKPEKMFDLIGTKKLLAVLLTHGHFDHLKAVDGLYKKYEVPVYLHKEDEKMARRNDLGRTFGLNNCPSISVPVCHLKEGKMKIGSFEIEVIFTPGHSKGSVCYIIENNLFSGDTLFRLGAGRTDLEGGDESELRASLRYLKTLDPDFKVLPGHDEESILAYEIENNYYLSK